MIHETQNLLPPEATRHHNSIKLLFFLPLRADLLCILQYETPCMLRTKFMCQKCISFVVETLKISLVTYYLLNLITDLRR